MAHLLCVFVEDRGVLVRTARDDLARVLLVDVQGQDTGHGGAVEALQDGKTESLKGNRAGDEVKLDPT